MSNMKVYAHFKVFRGNSFLQSLNLDDLGAKFLFDEHCLDVYKHIEKVSGLWEPVRHENDCKKANVLRRSASSQYLGFEGPHSVSWHKASDV